MQITYSKMKQRRLRAITLQRVIEKSLIFLMQCWKETNFNSTQIFCTLDLPILFMPL